MRSHERRPKLVICDSPALAGEGWGGGTSGRNDSSAIHVGEWDGEHQRCVRRNGAAGAAGAVAQRGRNDQGTLAADFHGGDAFIPAGDHPALPDRKLERLVAIDRRVEFLALLPVLIEPAGVMHDPNLTGLRPRSGSDLTVLHLPTPNSAH